MKMKYSKLSRSEFLQFVNSTDKEKYLNTFDSFEKPQYPPQSNELWAGWREGSSDEDTLPAIVIVGDVSLNDFLAWTINFIQSYRPLTAFVRVLSWSIFLMTTNRVRVNNCRMNSALVGAILGETLTNATDNKFMSSLPITAIESTYSYSMSKALILGMDDECIPLIGDSWQRAREFTEQPSRKVHIGYLQNVWGTLYRVCSEDIYQSAISPDKERIEILVEACREIKNNKRLTSNSWYRLSGGILDTSLIDDNMRSTKEHRVDVFENVARKLRNSKVNEHYRSFIIGYLASLVSDGSLEHAHLIFPMQNEMPAAMLWYGVCGGLKDNNSILSDYNHLGLRILRIIRRHENLLSPPMCDISLSELEILFRGSKESRWFRKAQSASLRIELFPMVTTVVRWIVHQSNTGQLGLFNGEEDNKRTKKDLQNDVKKMNKLVSTLYESILLAESLIDDKQEGMPVKPTSSSRGKRRR